MANRTVMTVLREIATVKAQVSDADLRAKLLAPLLAEVQAMADANLRQGKLPLTGDRPQEERSKK